MSGLRRVMPSSSHSKLWWIFGLFLRLALITLGCLALAFSPILLPLKFKLPESSLLPLVGLGLLAGYTWAVWFRLPSRTIRLRLFISAGIAVPLAALCFIVIFAVGFCVLLGSPQGAIFHSPMNPANEILFVDSGTQNRDFFLWAMPKDQSPQFVGRPQVDGYYRFVSAQWTKDGQVVVCSVILLGGVADCMDCKESELPRATVVAYDFSHNRALLPDWLRTRTLFFDKPRKEPSWREFEPIVEELIFTHGGLSDIRITDDMVRHEEETPPFWESSRIATIQRATEGMVTAK